MTDTVTISRECAKRLFIETQDETAAAELGRAFSSPSPSSGLREALEEIVVKGTRTRMERVGDMYSKDGYQEYTEIDPLAEIAMAALASADDGWVPPPLSRTQIRRRGKARRFT